MSQRTTEPSLDGLSVSLVQRITTIPTAFTEASLRLRLDGPPMARGLLTWGLPVIAAIIGGLLRFIRLGEPDSLIFDETYYVKDAYSLLISGYEREWPENANDSFNAGNPGVLGEGPEYVVHPPVGKWMIAFGMLLFGADNSFGWRFSAAMVGTLSILLIAFAAQKLFRSAALAGVAALLIAVDGQHLVQSRTSLLDIFLMFWVLAAFCALLMDRQQSRRRLASYLASSAPRQLLYGPWIFWRPWRIAAGVCLGLAVGTKWSGLFYLAAFGVMTVLWDMNARRIAGIRHWAAAAVMQDGLFAFVCMVPVAAVTYLSTWTGWFLSADGYNRRWAQDNPSAVWGWVPDSLRSLADYHRSAYTFHQGLSSEHSYEASAWSWLLLGRPTSFYYEDPKLGEAGCQVESCSVAITSLGNPLIWWSAALCLLVLLFYWIGRRDWRAGAILAGVAAGYLPWFLYPERTTFFFYSIVFLPFLILGLTYCLGLLLGPTGASVHRRNRGMLATGLFVALSVGVSAFFLPVWTAETIPYEMWRLRMWMPSWI
ncbi:dolichyl-phosphate-mannose--protein O-mannosyl transferase [Arthrobacter roseus]|nr:dolichyl-phosphate-mannose--protein O-mannosyl transferase [Arthrobacter roseus]